MIGSFSLPVYAYTTPLSWDIGLVNLDPPSSSSSTEAGLVETPIVALVKGPKRAGKSTFGRAALNRLLRSHEKVAWLECDLGQGELGFGGTVGIWIIDRPIFGMSKQ